MRQTFLFSIFFLGIVWAALDLKPVNQSGPGAGMWLSFRSTFPAPLCDPSALMTMENPCLFSSRWHPWAVKDITVNNVWASLPMGNATLGLGYFQIGHRVYNESRLWVAYSRRLRRSFVGGIVLSENRVAIRGYGNARAILPTVSIHQKIGKIYWGLVLDNPLRVNLGQNKEPLPYGSVVSAGTGNTKMWVQGEWKIGRYLSSGPSFNMALFPMKEIAVSMTAFSNTQSINISMELDLESIFVSYSLQHSAIMQSITHHIGLGFRAVSLASR